MLKAIINKIKGLYKKYPRLSIVITVLFGALIAYGIFGGSSDTGIVATFEARKGDLDITVVEGGTVEALESQEIRCEVATGYQGTKILKIIEEGYFVTDEDVKNGLVLVELDSSDLKDRLLTQEIQFQSSLAALTEARQNFDIQLNQSKLDIKNADKTARFAYMDFAKYVGDKLAADIVQRFGMKEQTNADTIDLSKLEQALKPLLSVADISSTNEDSSTQSSFSDQNSNGRGRFEDRQGHPGGSQIQSGAGSERRRESGTGAPSDGAGRRFGQRQGGQRMERQAQQNTESQSEPSARGDSARGQADLNRTQFARAANPQQSNIANPNANTPASTFISPLNNTGAGHAKTLSVLSTIPDELFSVVGAIDTNQVIDFSKYAKPELLGDGSAKQDLRKLLDELQLAKAQLSLEETKLQGTERLYKKGFISKTELEGEQMTYTNNILRVATAQTALDLFIKYEFPKQAEELLSKYDQALRALERTKKEAVSKVAQALAKLRAAESQFKIQSQQRQDLIDKIDKCIIRAQKSGLVVYANDSGRYSGSNEQIREGATVRERQTILTIPDMKSMAVRVKIHESYIKRIQKGLKAKVQVDAFPEDILNGEVTKVSVIPDSGSRWMNPDLKIYPTVVSITDEREWLKPGMSAKVEIMVKRLTNVVYIPLQAVTVVGGKQVCYVQRSIKPEMRIIEAGDFNDEFIEVKKGLKEGERVLLMPPPPDKRGNEEPAQPQEEETQESSKRIPGETLKLSPENGSSSLSTPTSTDSDRRRGSSTDSPPQGRGRRGGAQQQP
ncbi:MAG: efflux RND transporter periplasmic adaptor subunit [Verrucomicrobiia bacterium]